MGRGGAAVGPGRRHISSSPAVSEVFSPPAVTTTTTESYEQQSRTDETPDNNGNSNIHGHGAGRIYTHIEMYPAAAEHRAPTRKHIPLIKPSVVFPIRRTPVVCRSGDPAGLMT